HVLGIEDLAVTHEMKLAGYHAVKFTERRSHQAARHLNASLIA
ncbi:MAG: hypothetical protein JWR01_2592, partial [Subtercola sp.]|nr:hypothetical protein [Subtercola sp.]